MKQRGFTILEFLIYIALVGTILVVMGTIYFHIMQGKATLVATDEVSQSARFILEKVADVVRNADAITSPLPGNSATSLVLQTNVPQNNLTIFDLVNGEARITEGSGNPTSITSKTVTVTNLTFTNVSYPNAPGAVRIALTLRFNSVGQGQEYDVVRTFYTTTNIRKR